MVYPQYYSSASFYLLTRDQYHDRQHVPEQYPGTPVDTMPFQVRMLISDYTVTWMLLLTFPGLQVEYLCTRVSTQALPRVVTAVCTPVVLTRQNTSKCRTGTTTGMGRSEFHPDAASGFVSKLYCISTVFSSTAAGGGDAFACDGVRARCLPAHRNCTCPLFSHSHVGDRHFMTGV